MVAEMSTPASPLTAAFSLAETGGSLIMGLLAAHDKRVQAAKEENAALNQATSAFLTDAKTIFAALNAGDITAQVAINAISDVRLWFWSYMVPYVQSGCISSRAQCASTTSKAACGAPGSSQPMPCKTPCCATCCVGCNFFEPAWNDMIGVVQKGGGTASWCQVGGNQYGYTGLTAGSITYKKPKVTNPEAEVTLSKTGIVTVGAAPSNSDVVIASGVESATAQPDTGGDVIPHTAAGTDVTTALVPSTVPWYSNQTVWVAVGSLAAVAAIFLALSDRR